MCFSATASFAASAILTVIGAHGTVRAMRRNQKFIPVAMVPLFFGIQQFMEGMVWLGIDTGDMSFAHLFSFGFLFFSHFFWLVWIPFGIYFLEQDESIKKLGKWLIGLGLVYGLGMYIPLLIHHDWVEVSVQHHSIVYMVNEVFQLSPEANIAARVLYVLIALAPFFIATEKHIKIFGALAGLTAAVTWGFYAFAFTSVWCFFAAILSLYIVYVVHYNTSPTKSVK